MNAFWKGIILFVAFITVFLIVGCASIGHNPTKTEAYRATLSPSEQKKVPCTPNKVVPYTIAGAAGGGSVQLFGYKNAAAAGALLGLMGGIMRDQSDCDHAETVRQVEERSGGNSVASLRSQADEKESLDLYKECEEILAGKSKETAGRSALNCKSILKKASDFRTEVATEKLIDKVYTIDGDYGRYGYGVRSRCSMYILDKYKIRPGSYYEITNCERALAAERGYRYSSH